MRLERVKRKEINMSTNIEEYPNMIREEIIQNYINWRKRHNHINKCVFCITAPGDVQDARNEKRLDSVRELLDRNNVNYHYCDTVMGSWNLDSEWIETEKFECVIEYSGVYPIHWNIKDVVEFEALNNDGKIVTRVYLVDEDGNYIPNH